MLVQIVAPGRRTPACEGWERRFTTDSQRVKEAVELYSQLGYEVRMEAAPEPGEECGGCHAVAVQFKTIYTRKKS